MLNTDEECTKRKVDTMDSQARLTHPLQVLSWKASGSVGQTARWVPWEKTVSKFHSLMNHCEIFQSRFQMDETGLKLRLCFDVKKNITTNSNSQLSFSPQGFCCLKVCRTEIKQHCCFKTHVFIPSMTKKIGCKMHFPVTP